ncbi:MAG: anaerobic ribonucleoside-triphosphate reductase activating protein [Bacilli bacterium]
MQISGLIKNSFVDYPGEVSIVIFTPFCNMNCFYCHNRQLIENPPAMYDEEEILKFIVSRVGLIEAVVISGGEPTLQKDLVSFIKKIKSLGFLVKLDTNGSNIDVVKELISNKLIDYIAIDYKASLNKYKEITGYSESFKVLETINYCRSSCINYEVRTTLCPTLTMKDIDIMNKELGNVKLHNYNNYRVPELYNKEDEKRIRSPHLSVEEILKETNIKN